MSPFHDDPQGQTGSCFLCEQAKKEIDRLKRFEEKYNQLSQLDPGICKACAATSEEVERLRVENEQLRKPPTDEELRNLLFQNEHYQSLKVQLAEKTEALNAANYIGDSFWAARKRLNLKTVNVSDPGADITGYIKDLQSQLAKMREALEKIKESAGSTDPRKASLYKIYILAKEALALSGKEEERDAKYPCAKCGKLRTKDEGGTTFTVCDKCWDSKKEEGRE